jgi:hypothetical protein
MLKTEIKTHYEKYVEDTFKNGDIKRFLITSEFVKAFHNKLYENLALEYMTGKIKPSTLELMIKDLSRVFCRQVLNMWEGKIKSKKTDFSDFVGDKVAQDIYNKQEKNLSERNKVKKIMDDIEEEFNYTGKIEFQGQTILNKKDLER